MEKTRDKIAYLNMLKELIRLGEEENVELADILFKLIKYYPYVGSNFDKIFAKQKEYPFYKMNLKNDTYFYQKMAYLLPTKRENLFSTLSIDALNKDNEDFKYYNDTLVSNYNYYIFLLMFSREFNNLDFSHNKDVISKYDNIICGSNKNVLFTMEKDKQLDLSMVEIIIPNEVRIKYDASSYQLKRSVDKLL